MNKRAKTALLLYFIANFIILSNTIYNTFDYCEAQNVASSYCLIEASSKRVLKGENIDARKENASTTKILTAILVLENLSFDDVYSVPDEAIGVEGSSIYLRAGDMWTVKDLLYGMMLRSGNDAATALAILASGSIESFVEKMNAFCRDLGLRNTHFDNPSGLHSDMHYTSAYDLACITAVAMEDERFCDMVSTRSYEYRINGEVAGVFYNKNKLLGMFDGANGVKTGYTTSAGRCFVGSALKDEMQLVCVTLGIYDTYRTCSELLNYGFDTFKMSDISGGLTFSACVSCSDVDEYVDISCLEHCLYPYSGDDVFEYCVLDIGIDGVSVDDGRVMISKALPVGSVVARLCIYHDKRLIFEGELCTI